MANWIVGAAVLLLVAAAIVKMVKDKKTGKGGCSCGGDCSKCKHCH